MSTFLSLDLEPAEFWNHATLGELFHDGDLFFVPLDASTMMFPIISELEPFNLTTERAQDPNSPLVKFPFIINAGTWQSDLGLAISDILAEAPKVLRSVVKAIPMIKHEGLVVINEKTHQIGVSYTPVDSACPTQRQERYYVRFDSSQTPHYTFGEGDPPHGTSAPADQISTAVGGLIPMIVNGTKFGDRNQYADGTDEKELMPEVCRPDPDDPDLVLMRHSTPLVIQENRGSNSGKAVLAFALNRNRLLVMAQEDFPKDKPDRGITLFDLRDKLAALEVTDALSMDGSDSSFLAYKRKVIVEQGEIKNLLTPVGMGFT